MARGGAQCPRLRSYADFGPLVELEVLLHAVCLEKGELDIIIIMK